MLQGCHWQSENHLLGAGEASGKPPSGFTRNLPEGTRHWISHWPHWLLHCRNKKTLEPGRETPFTCRVPLAPATDKAYHYNRQQRRNVCTTQLQCHRAGRREEDLELQGDKLITSPNGTCCNGRTSKLNAHNCESLFVGELHRAPWRILTSF